MDTNADLTRLLETHGAALRRIAGSWSRSDAERDDLLQEIGLALWTAWPRYRQQCPERAYVWRVALNCAFAHRRRHQRHEHLPEPLEHDASDAPSPDNILEKRQQREQLLRAIRQLPAETRALVTMQLEGLSLEEIAAVVGGNANAIGVRLHRAKAALLALVHQPAPPRPSPIRFFPAEKDPS